MADVRSEGGGKWKTKHRQRESAARMRAIKAAKRQPISTTPAQETGADSTLELSTSTAALEPAVPVDLESRPESSDSENGQELMTLILKMNLIPRQHLTTGL